MPRPVHRARMERLLAGAVALVLLAAPPARGREAAPGAQGGCPPPVAAAPGAAETGGSSPVSLPRLEDLGRGDRRPQCLAGVRQAAAWQRRGGLRLIDLRPAGEARREPVPGAVRLAPHALAQRGSWRDDRLLLLGSGYDYRTLDALCEDLREAGFRRVRVLAGGAPAWRAARGLAADGVRRIRPSALLAEAGYRYWRLLDLDAEAALLAGGRDPARLARARASLARKAARLTGEGAPGAEVERLVLVVTGDGGGYAALAPLVEQAVAAPVVYLEGGRRAYRALVRNQLAIWQRRPGKQGGWSPCEYL